MFRPENSMSLETGMDRFFVNLFVIGVPLGLLGLPLFPIGIFHGIRLVGREHITSRHALFSILAMTLGIAAAVYIIIGTIEARRHYSPSKPHGQSSAVRVRPPIPLCFHTIQA